jgi:SAM-dependent methyltransferase
MREQGLTFGAVAALYDEVRPSYPDQLIDDVVGLLPGRDVVEVGAGTGKATAKLAARGLRLTCVEPDPAMARILVARCRVPVVISSFEQWEPVGQFDGLVSAQAWHWADPETRCDKAATLLRPGGLLALFWNTIEWDDREAHRRIDEVYDAHDLYGTARPLYPVWAPGATEPNELVDHAAFEYLGLRSYHWTRSYPAADFVALLNTTSQHRILPERQRDSISGGILAVLDDEFVAEQRTDLYLARRGPRDLVARP